MGFHNVLTGEDLHEPSRVRIVNDTQQTLVPGRLVRIDGPVVEGILSVNDLAADGDILVGFVDNIIAAGNESTIVLFGRLLNVEVENPTTNDLVEGDFLRVGSNSRFEKTEINEGRVGIVLRRGAAQSTTMNVLFNPISASKAPTPQFMYLTRPDGIRVSPLTTTVPISSGATEGQSGASPLQFLNSGQFTEADNNDSLTLIESASASTVNIEKAGAYEFSTSSSIAFNHGFGTIDDISESGVVNTAMFTIGVSVTKGDAPTEIRDIFRIQSSATFLDGIPTTFINFSGNLEPSSTSTDLSITDFDSTNTNSKIINLEKDDVISFFYEIAVERDTAATTDGNILFIYNNGTSTDSFFDWGFTINRIQ